MIAPRAVLRPFGLFVLLTLAGCQAVDPLDTLVNAVEGLARGACDHADNCRNVCPDGSTARKPGYRCPAAE